MSQQDEEFSLTRRDLLKIGAVAGIAATGLGVVRATTIPQYEGNTAWAGLTTGAVTTTPSMCQMCTTACGILGHVKDGRLLRVTGNPEDPNSQGSVCAKGAAGPSILYDPYRVLYPLRRVGARGEGKWKRITWDEAYAEIADHLGRIRRSGHPEEFAFQQGRNRSSDITTRFLDAYGTPSAFNHRALCSSNHRAAILHTIGDSDWDLGDFQNSQYILNFGCNWAEAHQGHIPVAIRMMRARERNAAKIVTFEARLSNTAAISDEWFCVKPGTDGLLALAMANVICQEERWDREWFNTWSNYPPDDYASHLEQYSLELAERESGVPATVIQRLAREFAAAAPRATTICNRGSSAHWNGFYNDRAITLLNAVVGNMGKPGGWCWHPNSSFDARQFPVPEPVPPKPKVRSIIADAKEWPLANALGRSMKVGQVVYLWIREGRQKVSAFMSYNSNQAWAWPEMGLVKEVLQDEDLIPFHFSLDVMYSETAHLADIVLPWTTYLERWDIDARPPQDLVDYVGLRQPLVAPLGESKDLREILPELARRIGDGMQEYFPWQTTEEYLEEYFKAVPGGLAYMKTHGAWQDPDKKPNYEPYLKELTADELEGARLDESTGLFYALGEDGEEASMGILVDGVPRRGFDTPSRKLEVYNRWIGDMGDEVGKDINPLPVYVPIPDHANLADDELIMISFKWNVHNAHRTMQSKWLQEIVHSNPAWLNPRTAERFGLQNGDWVEIVGFRPRNSQTPNGDGSRVGSVRTPIRLTEGVHPLVIALSHNAGRSFGGPIASVAPGGQEVPGIGKVTDPDGGRVWWQDAVSVAQNDAVPIYPDPTTGQQAWHDTRVQLRKVSRRD